jgi:hypothetical protein
VSRLAAVALAALRQDPPGAPEPLEVRVNRAIDCGAAWLKKEQKPDGTFEHEKSKEYPSGVAALGFLTLVKSGVAESDPTVQRSLRFFEGFRSFQKTYSTGVLLMAFEALRRGERDLPIAEAATKWLVEHRDEGSKLWAYPEGEPDLSNTQYALLGLHAAGRMGVAVPKVFLMDTLVALLERQNREGTFSYRRGELGTGSMTVAALSDLRIGAMQLKGSGSYEARRHEFERAEKSAWEWLESHFRPDANPVGPGGGNMRPWTLYYLYGLERACSLAGKEKLGSRWWYREGAEHLLSLQKENGSWEKNLVDTCFALLFLKRATLTWSPEPKAGDEVVGPELSRKVASRPTKPRPEVPFLRSWLVCGPFALKRSEPFAKDEVGETALKTVHEGDKILSSNRKWKRVDSTEPILRLDRVLPPFDNAFAYAWTTVTVRKDQEALPWLGHDDGAKAWLNGKPIYENETYSEAAKEDVYVVPVVLRAGANSLLVKVFDVGYDCGLVARFATAQGEPVE